MNQSDPNCIIRAFENQPISIFKEIVNDKTIHWFKGVDIGNTIELTNIYASVQNFDEDEKGLKEVETLGGKQKILYLTSRGVYRLLYNSKKPIAKKFRRWVGDILDDIIFNSSDELRLQLQEQKQLLINHQDKTELEK